MTHRRTARLNEQLKRELSGLLSRKARDPRVEGVLLTDVRVTPDLWLARVFYRLSSESRASEDVQAGLDAVTPFLRRELGRILRIRRIPELRFLHDETLESASRIEQILRELGDDGPGAEGTSEEDEEGT